MRRSPYKVLDVGPGTEQALSSTYTLCMGKLRLAWVSRPGLAAASLERGHETVRGSAVHVGFSARVSLRRADAWLGTAWFSPGRLTWQRRGVLGSGAFSPKACLSSRVLICTEASESPVPWQLGRMLGPERGECFVIICVGTALQSLRLKYCRSRVGA